LLGGLHEDLNRVLKKPNYTPTPEREAELERLPVQIASEQEWTIYRMRDDSLIVDFFQGQFKNRLQCMTCKQVRSLLYIFFSMSNMYVFLDLHDIQRLHVPHPTHTDQELEGEPVSVSGSIRTSRGYGEVRRLVRSITLY
jgi:ubiquitin C-terminal hydrolase